MDMPYEGSNAPHAGAGTPFFVAAKKGGRSRLPRARRGNGGDSRVGYGRSIKLSERGGGLILKIQLAK